MFKQYSDDLELYYQEIAKGKNGIPSFYCYCAKESDTIFSIAARCNIPYDTIATLNQIASADVKLEGKLLVLPASPGIFVCDNGIIQFEKTKNTLEALVQKKLSILLEYSEKKDYNIYSINGRYYVHFPGERLDQTARSFFLDTQMKSPLDQFWLSSDFGYRESPFTGAKQFHRGIDMAAPEGTKVYACKSGKIQNVIKNDKTFGNYIVIKHVNGLSSIYAHLSKVEAAVGDSIVTGQEIGLVGKTGQVTGPHLHFEIRLNGQPADPGAYIKK